MKQFILISTLLLFVSCSSDTKTTTDMPSTESTVDQKSIIVDNALTFINAYIDNCNKMKESVGVVEWANSNELSTIHFKTTSDKLFVCLSVKDNGMGIDLEKNKEKVFSLYKKLSGCARNVYDPGFKYWIPSGNDD